MTLAFICLIICFIVVGVLAGKANRSIAGWILLSLVITPFLAALILYFANTSEDVKGKKGLPYLIATIVLTILFAYGLFYFSKGGPSPSASHYEIAQSSQSGKVYIQSFEASSLGYSAQVHNGTNKVIETIDFRIVYFDKDGSQIDYRDAKSHETIDVGMTRKIEIRREIDAPRNCDKIEIQLKGYSHDFSVR